MIKVLVLGLSLLLGSNQMSDVYTFWADASREAFFHDKPVVVFFTSSDQCKPCLNLEEQVFSNTEFKRQTGDHIWLKIDIPSNTEGQSKEQQEHNAAMAEQYNPEGSFPKVIWVHPRTGELIATIDNTKSDLPSMIKAFKNAMDLFYNK